MPWKHRVSVVRFIHGLCHAMTFSYSHTFSNFCAVDNPSQWIPTGSSPGPATVALHLEHQHSAVVLKWVTFQISVLWRLRFHLCQYSLFPTGTCVKASWPPSFWILGILGINGDLKWANVVIRCTLEPATSRHSIWIAHHSDKAT